SQTEHELFTLIESRKVLQPVKQPTRQDKILDLVFACSLLYDSVSYVIPGFSDHEIVITELNNKHIEKRQNKKKLIYDYRRANNNLIKEFLFEKSNIFVSNANSGASVEELWMLLKHITYLQMP